MNLPNFHELFQILILLSQMILLIFMYFAGLFFLIVGSFTVYESVKGRIQKFFNKNRYNKG